MSEPYKSHHLSLWLEVILGSMATFHLNAKIKQNIGKNTPQRSSTRNKYVAQNGFIYQSLPPLICRRLSEPKMSQGLP